MFFVFFICFINIQVIIIVKKKHLGLSYAGKITQTVSNEKSPYLSMRKTCRLVSSGGEAFDRQRESVGILSIGYSTCHWCA